ncbi:hypothetical protein [Halovenus marina]|uniref:hypothetical protein n=1 Tax=Halovenus marina TaxID=3396621 RepID=UPI003F558A4A
MTDRKLVSELIDESPATEEDEDDGVSRRRFGALASGLVTLGALGGGYTLLQIGTEPALALDSTNQFIANGASVTAHDGSVSTVEFGDPGGTTDPGADDNRIALAWEGIDDPTHDDPNVSLAVRGHPSDFSGGAKQWEEVLSQADAVSITATNGTATYSWSDVFGQQTADVLSHSGLSASDFEATADGESRVRELQAKFRVEWTIDDEPTTLTAESAGKATITVTNATASATSTTQGSFSVDSDEEVGG